MAGDIHFVIITASESVELYEVITVERVIRAMEHGETIFREVLPARLLGNKSELHQSTPMDETVMMGEISKIPTPVGRDAWHGDLVG